LQIKEKRNDTSKPKGKTDGSTFVASDNNSDNGDVHIAFVGCTSDDSLLILDSAYSYHVCINRDLFSTYEPMQNGGTIRMGNNSPCEVVGMSTMQIKMLDGVVHTLTEVRHVQSMSKNLISLSTRYIKGYKYYAVDDMLKVTKGSLVVMKGDLKSTNLYVLRGS
jgi:type VI protein secretion system component VasA